MPELNANIPIQQWYVRGNFLRDQQDSHDKKFPCVVFGVASMVGKPPLFHFLMEDGGLWWRMPISAFCTHEDAPPMHLKDLVLWDCLSNFVTVTEFDALGGMRMSYRDREGETHKGRYLFTLDWHTPDPNTVDCGYSNSPNEHKCGHVIELDNGNIAIQPNNRVRLFEPSFTVKDELVIERLVNTYDWTVETGDDWLSEDTQLFEYGMRKPETDD
jgi:hypothetical protein